MHHHCQSRGKQYLITGIINLPSFRDQRALGRTAMKESQTLDQRSVDSAIRIQSP